jgi:putative methylase
MQLEDVKGFVNPKADLEQYMTPLAIVHDWMKRAKNDLQNKHVLDLGCGTGMLGIAASPQARKITFLDIDKAALDVLRQNVLELNTEHEIIHSPLKAIQADIVLTNPPFGTKNRHADKFFVQAACQSAPIVYSMHLKGSEDFIADVASEYGHKLTDVYNYSFPIANTMPMHNVLEKRIEVVVIRLAQAL